ncbi:MAG: ammonium transporter [Gemmatimonadota bacterium]
MQATPLSAGDTAWVLASAALVLLMVPGLALFYGGMVRGKNVLNTLMMSMAALAVVGVQWILIGYSLSFGGSSSWIGGLELVGFAGVTGAPADADGTIPHLAFAVFQGMFAVITVALISGALVERMSFRAYLLFAILWTTLVYDPLCHWVWGEGGWLGELGALDFAGGTVVHISAGASALIAAVIVGPRRDYRRLPLVPHNVPFTLFGAGLLWFGWFGFNAGSALSAGETAAVAFAATFAAPAAALTMWILLDLYRTGRTTAVGAATGVVVGLVAVTPAAGFVTPVGALAIGALAASVSYGAIQLRSRIAIDDSLDVFACHGVAGVMGALLTGVFATTAVNPDGADGLLHGGTALIGAQAIAVLATLAFAGVLTAVILKLVALITPLRVPVGAELGGLDVGEHGEAAHHFDELGVGSGVRPSLGESVLVVGERWSG